MNNIDIALDVKNGPVVPLKVTSGQTVPVGVDTAITAAIMPHYGGPYIVTPSEDAQTLQTQGMALDENITIGAIPSNYGRITWNGSVLSVT